MYIREIDEARRLIFDVYNIFPFLSNLINTNAFRSFRRRRVRELSLLNEGGFGPSKLEKVKSAIGRLLR